MIRIVYDGAPEAGKTTNVRQLSEQISLHRRGASQSPGTTGDRTEFFDWLDFSGGYLDGRRVRCQLVSVPGQPRLLHRRRYLLETADAIVFVADSRRDTFAEATTNFAATTRILDRVARGIPIGVVLQANKQDLAGALPPTEVQAALGLHPSVVAVGTVASSGDGVMQTFILAVRLATDRVRALLLRDPLSTIETTNETPEALHSSMVEVEARAAADQREAEVVAETARGEAEQIEAERIEAERLEAERIEAERIEAERIEAERIEAERREAQRLEAQRLEAQRLEAQRLEAQRLEAERLEAERLEAQRLEAERIEAERLEAERIEVERREVERREAQRREAERLEAERHEAERREAERLAAERIDAERLEAQRLEAQRLEVQRLEAERREAERREAERREAERREAERREAERLAAERREAERIEAERLEAERIAAERIEAERIEAERREAERIEAERREAQRLEAQRLEAQRLEAQRLEAERLEAQRLEAERLEAQRIEAQRLEAERLEAQRREAERRDTLRLEAERRLAVVTSIAVPSPSFVPAAAVADSDGSRRSNRHELRPPLPNSAEIAAGHVWPPVKGRVSMTAALARPGIAPKTVCAWAPLGAFELATESGWIVHTTDRWWFDSEPVARRRLLSIVRNLLARPSMIPEGRALALSTQPGGFRLWSFTPAIPSVRESVEAALVEGNTAKVIAYVSRTIAALQELGPGAMLAAGLGGITLHDARFGILSIDEGEDALLPSDPIDELFDLLDRHAHADVALSRWLDTDGLQILARAREARRA